MKKLVLVLAIGALLVLSLYLASQNTHQVPQAPQSPTKCADCNIIIISFDSLRADHVGYFGYSKNTTPNIDKFCDESTVFKNAVTQGHWTLPSFASIFTSTYPSVHGELKGINNTSLGKKIPKNLVTLPEILKKNNYTTFGISSIPYFSSIYGFDRGFDTFDDSWGFNSFDNVQGELKMVYDFLPNVTDEAVGFIRNNSNKKFFLLVHYNSPHAPYNNTPLEYIQDIPSNANITHLLNIAGQEGQLDNETVVNNLSPEEIAFIRSAYDGKIRYADSEINKILNEVKNQHLEGKTIIVIMSDHGENLGEYGYFGHGRETPNNETAYVPLIVKIPNTEPQTINRYVQTMDIAPTLLDAAGIEKPDYYQGRNLFSNDDEVAYQEYINYVVARKSNQEVVYNKETGEMNSSWDGGIRDFNAKNEALVKKLNITYDDIIVPQYIIDIMKKRGLIR